MNDSILAEMKLVNKQYLTNERIREIYLERCERKEDFDWVHKRISMLHDMDQRYYSSDMRRNICKLEIPDKDKDYLLNLVAFQSLLHNFDHVVDKAERIIKKL